LLRERLQKKERGVRVAILKARQVGISTFTTALIYAFPLAQEGVNSLILADDIDGANYLLEMVKLYQEMLAGHLRQEEKKSNEKKLEFLGTHSQILIDTANNENAGRKYTYQYMHLSEVAYFPERKVKILMDGLLQAVPEERGTLVVMESTANGRGNYFYDLWTGKNDWEKIFFAWWEEERYTIETSRIDLTQEEKRYRDDVYEKTGVRLSDGQMLWRRMVIKNKLGGETEKFNQEYPAYAEQAFLTSGRCRFDNSVLMNLRAFCREPQRREGNWQIWREPELYLQYVIGVDTAEGIEGGNNSVAQILDVRKKEVVAKYRGKIEPEAFGYELAVWGRRYNMAQIAVEVNNHGLTVLTVLKNIYPHLYYRKVYDRHNDRWTEQLGWKTTSATKPFLIDHLSQALREGLYTPSLETVLELETFIVYDNGRAAAEEGKMDDEVISLAIANQAMIEGRWDRIEPERIPEKYSPAWFIEQDEIEAQNWRKVYASVKQ